MLLFPRPSHCKTLAAMAGIAISATGCAVSRDDFSVNPGGASSYRICNALQGSAAQTDSKFKDDLNAELSKRNVKPEQCSSIINEQHTDAGLVILAGVAYLALSAISPDKPSDPNSDWEWKKEDHDGKSEWVCQNKQSGARADDKRCPAG